MMPLSSQEGEYVEESMDDWADINFSQISDSRFDDDSLLKPLSNSQQAMIENLDLHDNEIVKGEEKHEKMACEEHDDVVDKHKNLPAMIPEYYPPGLVVIDQDRQLTFRMEHLSLERDFHWTGRQRLVESGLTQAFINKMLGSSDSDLLHFVRYLNPGNIASVMIDGQDDFESVVDFLFYAASVCEDEMLFSILKKALFELLRTYSYSWSPTPRHFVTVLSNFGANPELIMNDEYFSSLQEENLVMTPAVDKFYSNFETSQRNSKLLSNDKIKLLSRFMNMFSGLLRIPGPDRLETYKNIDKKNWKTIIFIVSVVSQDVVCMRDPSLLQNLSSLLHCLLSFLTDENDIQDVVEINSNKFMPRKLVESACTWSQDTCPPLMNHEDGYNHQHNMLHVARVFPPAYGQVKQLLSYISIQMILCVSSVDLPGLATVMDLKGVLEKSAAQYKKYCDGHHYTAWCLLRLIDIFVDVNVATKKVNTEEFKSLKWLLDFVDQFNIINFKGKKDPKKLDQSEMIKFAESLVSRWRLYITKAENIYKLKIQISEEKNSQ